MPWRTIESHHHQKVPWQHNMVFLIKRLLCCNLASSYRTWIHLTEIHCHRRVSRQLLSDCLFPSTCVFSPTVVFFKRSSCQVTSVSSVGIFNISSSRTHHLEEHHALTWCLCFSRTEKARPSPQTKKISWPQLNRKLNGPTTSSLFRLKWQAVDKLKCKQELNFNILN